MYLNFSLNCPQSVSCVGDEGDRTSPRTVGDEGDRTSPRTVGAEGDRTSPRTVGFLPSLTLLLARE